MGVARLSIVLDYIAAAEAFEFQYGESASQKSSEPEAKEAIRALETAVIALRPEDEATSKYVKLVMKIESAGSNPEIGEKLAEMSDTGFFGSQQARELATALSITDKQFEGYQELERNESITEIQTCRDKTIRSTSQECAR